MIWKLFDFYLQIYALIYAKIALYHGIDLEVDSDIAPKELIDNTPAKEYPEPYEFMKKFDLKTIIPEEWKAWIYEYCLSPEELKGFEERGYFIQEGGNMADITDVYVRIKYKKNGKIYEDDLLEDIDMYDALSDMEYNGLHYEIDDKLIMRLMVRN